MRQQMLFKQRSHRNVLSHCRKLDLLGPKNSKAAGNTKVDHKMVTPIAKNSKHEAQDFGSAMNRME